MAAAAAAEDRPLLARSLGLLPTDDAAARAMEFTSGWLGCAWPTPVYEYDEKEKVRCPQPMVYYCVWTGCVGVCEDVEDGALWRVAVGVARCSLVEQNVELVWSHN